jgi:flagellar motor switch protein FliM
MTDTAAPAKTEAEMLAEWQNMAADAQGAAPAVDTTKILDQNEIDSLLGVGKSGPVTRGVRALVDTNIVNYEKLPMLEVIFDKFERFLSTSLRQFTADNVDISIMNMTSVRFGEYLNNVALPAGLLVVNVKGLDDYILIVYEPQLVFSVVDVLLGGRKAKPARGENRAFSTIERKLLDNFTTIILHDLGEAFAPVSPVQFIPERMEMNPRFAMITREKNACILVTVRISLEEREGLVYFCIPYATLEPIRDQLLQQFMGEKAGQDNIWETHLSQELYHTNVPMFAVMDELKLPLGQVLNWKLGDTVVLNAKPTSPVRLDCGTITKLVGRMGKVDQNKAVRVTRTVTEMNNEGG